MTPAVLGTALNTQVQTCLQAQGLAEFLLRMLKFHPDARGTAQDLLDDPWLKGELPEAPPELYDIVSRKRHRSAMGTSSGVAPDGASGSGSGAARSSELSPVKAASAADTDTATLMPVPATAVTARSSKAVVSTTVVAVVADGDVVDDAAGLQAGAPAGEEALIQEDVLEAALRRSFSCPARLAGGDDAARFGAANGYNPKFCSDLQRYAVTLSDLAALERRDFEVDSQASAEYGFACYEVVPGGQGAVASGEGRPVIRDQAALIEDIYHLAADPDEAEALRSFNYNAAVDYAELLKERNTQVIFEYTRGRMKSWEPSSVLCHVHYDPPLLHDFVSPAVWVRSVALPDALTALEMYCSVAMLCTFHQCCLGKAQTAPPSLDRPSPRHPAARSASARR